MCRSWMTASKDEVKKGPPLTCILCKGVLILNAEGLKMHLGSKRHKKQQKRLEDIEQDTIVYAEDLQEDSSGVFLRLPAQRLPRTGLLASRCRFLHVGKLALITRYSPQEVCILPQSIPLQTLALPCPALPCPALYFAPPHKSLDLPRDESKAR